MSEPNPQEHEQLLHQIHSDVFLERLKDYIDPDSRSKLHKKDASDLNDIVRRLLIEDSSPSIGSDDLEMLLKDDAFRDQLKQSTHHLSNSQSKEET